MYITGDLHGGMDIKKLNKHNFPQQEFLTKKDYVLICGDFGLVWNNDSEEKYWRNWLNTRNFTTLFVDGNHDNHPKLNSYSIEIWNGGKIHRIEDSIIHLMRGQVYIINGKKFFTMGGAESVDKEWRIDGISWWKEEMPNQAEYDEALTNLENNNYEVDYIITHDCSSKFKMIALKDYLTYKSNNNLNAFFDNIEDIVKYKHWYFGHYHDDLNLDEKHTLLYDTIIKI